MQFMIYAASALGLGALHALEPGHGKTVVAAYLVGGQGRVRDAVLLGMVVTLTHTSSVILLAVLSLIAAQRFATGRVQVALELVAGLLVLMVGVWMLAKRRARRQHGKGEHSHSHAHPQEHQHREGPEASPALASRPRLGFGGLCALGISGGVVPCPAALAVLLAAVATGRLVSGIMLVAIFSVGMAVVLVAIGVAMVKASDLVKGRIGSGRWMEVLPMASAGLITLVGLALITKALLDLGVL